MQVCLPATFFEKITRQSFPKKDESSPNIGISSGTVLVARKDFKDVVTGFLQKKNLDLLLIMFVCFRECHEPKRHIFIASSSSLPNDSIGILSQLCNYLMVNHENDLMHLKS